MQNVCFARLMIVLSSFVAAFGTEYPRQNWAPHDRRGWSEPLLAAARHYAATKKTLAVMVVQNGRVVDQWGPADKKIEVRSNAR